MNAIKTIAIIVGVILIIPAIASVLTFVWVAGKIIYLTLLSILCAIFVVVGLWVFGVLCYEYFKGN